MHSSRNNLYGSPLKMGNNGEPELIKYMRDNFDFSHKDKITYEVGYHYLDDNLHYLGELLILAFNKPSEKVDNNGDVVFSFCC